MSREILTNARVVTPAEAFLGTVELHAGRIVRVELGATRAPGAQDLDGDLLLPGLVELHTDHLEKHLEPRPGVRWPAAAALVTHDAQVAAAGITTVLDALSVGDFDDSSVRSQGLEAVVRALDDARAAGWLRAEHFLHLRCELPSDNVVPLARDYLGHPQLKLVSLMDHTPGQRQWTDLEKFRTYTQKDERWSDATLNAEVERLRGLHARNAEPNREALIVLCRARGLAMASHDDTLEAHVHDGAAAGIGICEFPTTEAAARVARGLGMGVVMGAPNLVRGGSHSGNVSALHLARQDLLDALSSDYVPHALLHGAFILRDAAGWPLARAVAAVSLTPARLAGFEDRGAIAVGQRADLVRVRERDGVPVPLATWRAGRRIA